MIKPSVMNNEVQFRDLLSKALLCDDSHPTNSHSSVLKELAVPHLVPKHTRMTNKLEKQVAQVHSFSSTLNTTQPSQCSKVLLGLRNHPRE